MRRVSPTPLALASSFSRTSICSDSYYLKILLVIVLLCFSRHAAEGYQNLTDEYHTSEEAATRKAIAITPATTTTIPNKNVESIFVTNAEREMNRSFSPQARIVGGRKAPQEWAPYLTTIYYQKDIESGSAVYICGGILIAPDLVLSADHCSEKANLVQIGRYDLSKPEEESVETFRILKKVSHPKSEESTPFDYDFVVFKLDKKSVNHKPLRNLDYRSRGFWEDGKLFVMGYGTTDAANTLISNVPKYTDVKVLEHDKCQNDYFDSTKFTKAMMCASSSDGKDACQGDRMCALSISLFCFVYSGGPLLFMPKAGADASEHILVAVVSWGYGCADKRFPGVYARVSRVHRWIKNTMCDLSDTNCRCRDKKRFRAEGKTRNCKWVKKKEKRRDKYGGKYCPNTLKLC